MNLSIGSAQRSYNESLGKIKYPEICIGYWSAQTPAAVPALVRFAPTSCLRCLKCRLDPSFVLRSVFVERKQTFLVSSLFEFSRAGVTVNMPQGSA